MGCGGWRPDGVDIRESVWGLAGYKLVNEGRLLEGARDQMNAWPKLRLATATLAALVGVLCLAAVGYCFVGYVMDAQSPVRNEYLIEAALWSALSFPPFALAAILALTVRRFISRKLLWLLSLPVFAAGLLVLKIVFFLARAGDCSS
jgi:hypothetical protein